MSYIAVLKSNEFAAESYENGIPNLAQLRTAAVSISSQVSPPDLACIQTQNVQMYYLATTKHIILGLSSEAHPPRQVLQILKSIDFQLQTTNDYQTVTDNVRNAAINSKDKLQTAQEELQDVRKIMVRNLDDVLERGERVNLLVDRTAEMSQQATLFNQQARKLKHKTLWQNYKIIGIFCVALGSVTVFLTKVI